MCSMPFEWHVLPQYNCRTRVRHSASDASGRNIYALTHRVGNLRSFILYQATICAKHEPDDASQCLAEYVLPEAEIAVSRGPSVGHLKDVVPKLGLGVGHLQRPSSGHGIPRTIGGPIIRVTQTGSFCQILTNFWFRSESGRISSAEPLRI